MKLLKALRLFWIDNGVIRCSLSPQFFGGGGGPSQTTSTVTQSSVPDWLQPQTTAMLGAATQQIFNTSPSGEITGIKGYTPYSTNPQDYVAPWSPMQQQSFGAAANLQTPGQYNVASDIAGGAGVGALGSSQQAYGYGGLGAGYGMQGAGLAGANIGAGQQLQNTLINQGAMQQYMNPYVQNALAPQLNMMEQAAGRQQAQVQGEAAKAGAYGGSRQAIQSALVQQGLLGAEANLIGQGYNQAYTQAQQAAQAAAAQGLQGLGQANQAYQTGISGANVGLGGVQQAQAGYGQATQAAQTLGSLGGQQLAANENIINLQNQLGQQQQNQQQQLINQAVQNYANAQQYPMEQLGMYNALLRGYATPVSSQTQYTTVSPTQQLAGLGIAGLGALGQAGVFKAEGGVIEEPKKYASGGLIDLAIADAMGEE